MSSMLVIGIILATGFLMGEAVQPFRLPRITGYILAGILLNPQLLPIIPTDFAQHTDLVTDIALSFITFSVGGTLLGRWLKQMGRTILTMTVCEAEFAMLAVTLGFLLLAVLLKPLHISALSASPLVLTLLLGVLASPTDPSATLAVTHQYKARGEVTSTVMGIAASDDVLGIINFSLGVALARMAATHSGFSMTHSVLLPIFEIVGGIGVGVFFGWLLNRTTAWFNRETEGELIVLIFAVLGLCYGIARLVHADELLATMAMGCIVVNFNPKQAKIFSMLERYQEELIFVFFFTVSSMKLDLSVMPSAAIYIAAFVILRALGKTLGAYTGARLSGASPAVRRYTFLGLLPQGGIVIGLALIMHSTPDFKDVSNLVMAIVIGATVIHEIAGPIVSRIGLRKAGEIPDPS
ncbi:MAG: cation:proton antiporter [Kiritimatiellales bacterium]